MAVYHDLLALSNIAASGLMTAPVYTHNTNTAYNDIPTLSMNYTKQLAGSKLLIFGSMSMWVAGTAAFGTTLGVKVDGVTYDAGYLYHNSTTFHSTIFFAVPIPGLAAGAKTITWAEKSSLTDPARQAKLDANDKVNCIVIEIP
jgi:hypothetical protein